MSMSPTVPHIRCYQKTLIEEAEGYKSSLASRDERRCEIVIDPTGRAGS